MKTVVEPPFVAHNPSYYFAFAVDGKSVAVADNGSYFGVNWSSGVAWGEKGIGKPCGTDSELVLACTVAVVVGNESCFEETIAVSYSCSVEQAVAVVARPVCDNYEVEKAAGVDGFEAGMDGDVLVWMERNDACS